MVTLKAASRPHGKLQSSSIIAMANATDLAPQQVITGLFTIQVVALYILKWYIRFTFSIHMTLLSLEE